MQRNLDKLADQSFDLIIIGGGIHGACIAWDATQRGLSVALVEKSDFGQETSANSLKTVHGGLRYLQDANLGVVRSMIRERTALLRIAPHLVHPLPCLMPTYRSLLKSTPVLATAIKISDLMGFDRNHGLDAAQHLYPGRVISRQDCLGLLPGLPEDGVRGGVLWYDGQIFDTERLTLSFILSAAKSGAVVANYVEAVGLMQTGDRVAGITARDHLTGYEFASHANMVVNAAGPWVDHVLSGLPKRSEKALFNQSLAINLVTRQLLDGLAAGVRTRPEEMPKFGQRARSRLVFITPWREFSIVGTYHLPYSGHPDDLRVDAEQLEFFIEEINSAYPGAGLSLEDIRRVHKGLLPAVKLNSRRGVQLLRQGQVHAHRAESGPIGLISIVGVKYTAARQLAEKTVDIVFRQLGKGTSQCQTNRLRLHDGQIEDFGEYLSGHVRQSSRWLGSDLNKNLVYRYGSDYPRLLDLIESQAGKKGESPVGMLEIIRAVTLFALREEMAQKLVDVVLRRSGLGSAGKPDAASLRCCADVMAAELGWSQSRKDREIAEVEANYPPVFSASIPESGRVLI